MANRITGGLAVSGKGLAFIAAHEGFVSRAYLDPAGVLTIGYGFTMRSRVFSSWWLTRYRQSLRQGDSLSREDANRLLLTLLEQEYGPPVARVLPRLKQHQFDACVSAVYNLGARALGWKWARALAAGDVSRAARLLAGTGVTAGGRKLAGLVRRRAEEADLLRSGRYANGQSGPAGPDDLVKRVQEALAQLGYRPGPVDGIDGPRTRRALLSFQRAHPPLVIDGIAGPATRSALQRAVARWRADRAGVGSGILTVLAGLISGWRLPEAMIAGSALALLIVGIAVAWRYRGRLKRRS